MSNNQECLVLDVGSSKIAAVVGCINKSDDLKIKDRFIGQSDGIKSSVITDLVKAQERIIDVLFSVEKNAKNLFKEACVSICATSAKSHYVNTTLRISGSSVAKNDIQKLIHKALSDFNEKNQQVIHYFLINFTLDGITGITDPIGLLGKELSCNIHIISVDSGLLTNLMNCLAKCQIKVKDIVLTTYASALSASSSSDRQNGSLVVDFGCRSTSFAVLLDEKLMYFASIPLGSWYITSDIAKAFSISFHNAEKLKKLYGSSQILENGSLINLHEIDPNEFSANQVISVSDLSAVINPRVEEIFTLLKAKYTSLNVDDLIANNMILTGGGSQLSNIAQTVGDVFSKIVKVADNNIKEDEIYNTAFGMLKYIQIKQKHKFDLDKNLHNQSKVYKVWNWFKDNI